MVLKQQCDRCGESVDVPIILEKTNLSMADHLRRRARPSSHHRRAGWSSPFHAAWINLRAMFVYGVEFFTFKPGLVLLLLGLTLCLALSGGPLSVGPVHLSLYWMLLGATLSLLGLQSVHAGCLAQVLHDYTGSARRRWLGVFGYTRTVVLAAVGFAAGLALACLLVADYLRSGLSLSTNDRIPYLGVLGLVLMLGSFMTFTFVLLLHAAALRSSSLYGTHE